MSLAMTCRDMKNTASPADNNVSSASDNDVLSPVDDIVASRGDSDIYWPYTHPDINNTLVLIIDVCNVWFSCYPIGRCNGTVNL